MRKFPGLSLEEEGCVICRFRSLAPRTAPGTEGQMEESWGQEQSRVQEWVPFSAQNQGLGEKRGLQGTP